MFIEYRFCLNDPVNYLDPYGLTVGFGYFGGTEIGIGEAGMPGIPPDISGGGIPYPGAAQINSGGCGEDGGGGRLFKNKKDGKSPKKGTPKSNKAQNKQFRDAVNQIERKIGRRLNKGEIRNLHDRISGRDYVFPPKFLS